jgi:tRNA (guanine37-N1)-methyltransferase|tara:strand:- start:123 stop:926 length:804 start_codon:yes stop_codon:yes gene_type:complete
MKIKKLTKKEISLIPHSYDVIGSILIFSNFPKELIKKEKLVGEKLINEIKPVKTVCRKIGKYSGKYRLPKLKIIAGEKTKEILYKENNISLKLNIEKVYFSSRSGNERLRISKLVKKGEEVLVMFSGCAPFPCVIAKNSKAKSVVGIEINPTAHKYALENITLNKLTNVGLIKGNVRKVLPKKKFDRILMPLPRSAEDYLDVALKASKKGAVIHFYDFLNEEEFGLAKEKISKACKKAKKKFNVIKLVKCGHFGPNIYRVSLDFKVL